MSIRSTNWLTLYHSALFAWVALLPLQTRWIIRQGILAGGAWEYGTVSLYATDILLLIAGVAYLVLRRKNALRQTRTPVPIAGSIAALVVIASLSIFIAHDNGVALNALLRLLAGVLAWWLVVQSRLRLSLYALAIAISAAAESVLAFAQSMMQSISASAFLGIAAHSPFVAGDSVVETVGGRFLRAYGTLPHPNMLAGWLVIGALMTMWLFFRTSRRWYRVALLILGILIQAGLYCTFSRSAMIAWWVTLLSATVIVTLRMRKLRKQTLVFLFAGLLLAAVFIRVASPLVLTRVGGHGRLEAKSVTDRLVQFRDAQSLFAKHWMLGVGLGNYTNTLRDELDSTRLAAAYQPVHFVLWLAAVELGIVGLLILLWLCVTTALHSFFVCQKVFGNNVESVPWEFCGMYALGVLAWVSFFDHYPWSLPFGVMFVWCMLGLWQKSLSEE